MTMKEITALLKSAGYSVGDVSLEGARRMVRSLTI